MAPEKQPKDALQTYHGSYNITEVLFEFKEYTQSNWLVGTLCMDVNHAILSSQIILDYVILYYYHITKSGSKHLHLEYFRMCNLVQGDVKRQIKYIYIYV